MPATNDNESHPLSSVFLFHQSNKIYAFNISLFFSIETNLRLSAFNVGKNISK